MNIQPGTDIGRYHILEQLPKGGMAMVYKAYDTQLEREVAIKVIRTESFPPEQLAIILKRFEREAKAMANLDHHHIVEVFDYGTYEGIPYLVMPFLPGGSLLKLTGQALPWQQAVEMILPIAEALAYAHAKKMVHRDVKPGNILISEAGELKLSDFGIAKILESQDTLSYTTSGVGIGTPEYMAPEQAEGRTVDARADVYALGIVLYELITACKPFTADTPMAVVIKQIHDPLPDPKSYIPDLPVSVERALYKALAKQPDHRFANMKDFIEALRQLAEGREKDLGENKKSTSPAETIEFGEKEAPKSREKKAAAKPTIPKWVWGIGIGLAAMVLLFFLFKSSGGNLPMAAAATLTIPPMVAPSETILPTSTLVPTATVQPTPTLGIGSNLVSEKDGMTLLYVPAGEFNMGSNEGFNSEKPAHNVYLDAYWIDQTEVNNAQYKLCMLAGVCRAPNGKDYNDTNYVNHPVVNVDWNDAKTYCEWSGRRLPTEAEWEKVARGTDSRTYPWGEGVDCSKANYWDCVGGTVPVGSYPSGASPYGALDMAGNVWEWVADWYSESYYPNSPATNPTGPASGSYRTLRGGSWAFKERNMYVSARNRNEAGNRDSYKGFRCAMSVTG